MKILIFSQKYPKNFDEAIVSGMVKNPFYLSQALSNTGHQVTVITYGRKREHWNMNGVDVWCVGRGILKGVARAFIVDMGMTWRFIRLHKNTHFDLVHIHSGNALFLFLLKKLERIGIPIIYSVHGTSSPELRANLKDRTTLKNMLLIANGWIQEHIDRYMWGQADSVVSGSGYQIEEMVDLYSVPREKIACIHNGVDITRFYPDVAAGENERRQLGIGHDVPLVLFVGRAARKKGIDLLIRSAKEIVVHVPTVRFLLVLGTLGSQEDYRNEIITLIRSERLEQYFVIQEDVSEKRLPMLYNAATVCAFPSTGYESIPTVIYESMACGKPVLSQKSWGIVEVLSEVLLSEEDLHTSALSQHLIELLQDVNLRERLETDALQRIKEFSWDKVAERHVRLYEQVRRD